MPRSLDFYSFYPTGFLLWNSDPARCNLFKILKKTKAKMDGNGFLAFAGILVKVPIFAASIFVTTFLVDLASTGKRRWAPAVAVGSAVLIFAIYPGLIVSVIQSFSTGLSWGSIIVTIFGGFAAGGVFSGI